MKIAVFHNGERVSLGVRNSIETKTQNGKKSRVMTSPIDEFDRFFLEIPKFNEKVGLVAFSCAIPIEKIMEAKEKMSKFGYPIYTIRFGCATKTTVVDECIPSFEDWNPEEFLKSITA